MVKFNNFKKQKKMIIAKKKVQEKIDYSNQIIKKNTLTEWMDKLLF